MLSQRDGGTPRQTQAVNVLATLLVTKSFNPGLVISPS